LPAVESFITCSTAANTGQRSGPTTALRAALQLPDAARGGLELCGQESQPVIELEDMAKPSTEHPAGFLSWSQCQRPPGLEGIGSWPMPMAPCSTPISSSRRGSPSMCGHASDMVACSTFKWLMGSRAGFLYVRAVCRTRVPTQHSGGAPEYAP
jgi:hypothetical protein